MPCAATVRCHADVQLQVSGTDPAGALQEAVQQLEATFFTPQLVFMTEQGTTAQLQILPNSSSSSSGSKASTQSTTAAAAVLASAGDSPSASVVPLIHSSSSSSSSASSNGAPRAAPMFEFKPDPHPAGTEVTMVTLGLDVLVFAPDALPLAEIPQQLLVLALKQQLTTMIGQLRSQQKLVPVAAFHFQPPGWAHPITVCYPQLAPEAEANDMKLVAVRQQLHGVLGLPGNMPLLRQTNALVWQGAGEAASSSGRAAVGNKAARLLDVHATLPAPGFAGSTSLMSGSYEYCHYMQDRFNDAGWGCAYRSLQTIISWFRQQWYTNKPVPSHK